MSTSTQLTAEKKEAIGKALGRIATGVHIVTVKHDGKNDGMLTSWLGQAAFEPPMVSFAVKKERVILAALGVGNRCSVNVLSKKNMDIFKNFAKPYSDGLDRFEGLNSDLSSDYGAVFPECVSYMRLKVSGHADAGDHVLIIAEVVDAVMAASEEPMVHLRSNGFQY